MPGVDLQIQPDELTIAAACRVVGRRSRPELGGVDQPKDTANSNMTLLNSFFIGSPPPPAGHQSIHGQAERLVQQGQVGELCPVAPFADPVHLVDRVSRQ